MIELCLTSDKILVKRHLFVKKVGVHKPLHPRSNGPIRPGVATAQAHGKLGSGPVPESFEYFLKHMFAFLKVGWYGTPMTQSE